MTIAVENKGLLVTIVLSGVRPQIDGWTLIEPTSWRARLYRHFPRLRTQWLFVKPDDSPFKQSVTFTKQGDNDTYCVAAIMEKA